MKVKCPTCKKRVEYSSSNPHRPFCCERCRMIDLGEWADESYSIPLNVPNEHELDDADGLESPLNRPFKTDYEN